MGTLIPFPGVVVAEAAPSFLDETGPRKRAPRPSCIICGSNVDWDLHETCDGCGAVMHQVCYYGRVASVNEWLTFLRIADEENPIWPDNVCPACRAAKEGA